MVRLRRISRDAPEAVLRVVVAVPAKFDAI